MRWTADTHARTRMTQPACTPLANWSSWSGTRFGVRLARGKRLLGQILAAAYGLGELVMLR